MRGEGRKKKRKKKKNRERNERKVREQARPVVSTQHTPAQQFRMKGWRIDSLRVCFLYEPFSVPIPVEKH